MEKTYIETKVPKNLRATELCTKENIPVNSQMHFVKKFHVNIHACLASF